MPVLEPGDIEEALSAANAVGDDAIQKKMQGQVVPDSFTHGTSEQRMYWFNRGFKSGDFKKGTLLRRWNKNKGIKSRISFLLNTKKIV